MKISQIGELSLLETIRKKFGKPAKGVSTGIGDDSAVIKPDNRNLLITSDMMVEGIHFDRRLMTSYQLGFKLVSVNVSDIFAMAGIPKYLILDIALDKSTDRLFFDRFFDGIKAAIKFYGIALIGGDLSSSKKHISIAASLIGYADNPVKRSGARLGDRIYVTGCLGDSACGLEILKKIKRSVLIENKKSNIKIPGLKIETATLIPLLKRHLMPEARDPVKFSKYATSMIDLSDGLFIDLTRICNESSTGARLYLDKIPISNQAKKAAACLKLDPLKLAVSGGEDYELLFTAPADKKINAIYIGDITKKNRVIIDSKGRAKPFHAQGYQHFGI
ncbi:MAG: thiamine-phosphate kinase [Nitrospiraceae bacterium]|nr:thiamine-phosphate kinase [Nitrospiraceae bacterium]